MKKSCREKTCREKSTKENLTNLRDIPESPYGDIPDICFTNRGIQSQLESIRPDKACGADQIPARVLKETATELAPVLASLFQQSFDIGVLPSDWKYANINAIFKKGHRADPKNYRPVSLTSLTSKIIEHIVCKQICHHLSANSAIYCHQHGFQKGISCETQLISIIHEWASILNVHGQVDGIFLDFEKAFDSVPHERLLLKARFYGITGKLHYWLRDFLSGSRQRVVVNGSSSKWSLVLSGVSQGTVLGPILFLLFINDLPSGISSSVKLFADDSVLFRHIRTPADQHILQHDLAHLEEWAFTWQMNFSPSKCYKMSITLKRQPYPFTYVLNGTPLEGVTSQKYLGVHIS